jgi:hypothetical protein
LCQRHIKSRKRVPDLTNYPRKSFLAIKSGLKKFFPLFSFDWRAHFVRLFVLIRCCSNQTLSLSLYEIYLNKFALMMMKIDTSLCACKNTASHVEPNQEPILRLWNLQLRRRAVVG